MTTKRLYLQDFTATECEATVLAVASDASPSFVLLDQTLFYPQGGGQPYDQGRIEHRDATFEVVEVRSEGELVRHIGSFSRGSFRDGDVVECRVDVTRRRLHSRIHSAGHVVDMAVRELAPAWKPGKGYHFPQGPYVEYEGALEGERQGFQEELERRCNQLLERGLTTTVLEVPADQVEELCGAPFPWVPGTGLVRVVRFGDFGVPCGGTHVKVLGEIGSMTIRKVKADRGAVRVGYDVAR